MSDLKTRKVVTRSGRGFRGYFPSRKLDRMVEYESLLERDAIYLFELSPGVKSFQEQPELIMYEHEGRIRKYFPDFSVTLNSGEELHIEIKPADKLREKALSDKFKAIALRYESHPARFLILTEKEIRKEPNFSNLKSLYKRKRHSEMLTDDTNTASNSMVSILSHQNCEIENKETDNDAVFF